MNRIENITIIYVFYFLEIPMCKSNRSNLGTPQSLYNVPLINLKAKLELLNFNILYSPSETIENYDKNKSS